MNNKNIWLLPIDREPIKGQLILRHISKKTPNECRSLWQYNETVVIDNIKQYTVLNGSFRDYYKVFKPQRLYITSNETPKLDEWGINTKNDVVFKDKGFTPSDEDKKYCKKIILTDDPELIEYGVQAIDDVFLEWFCKNSYCEKVEVEDWYVSLLSCCQSKCDCHCGKKRVIIPKEGFNVKPKQKNKTERLGFKSKKLFTDYPITELGDEEFKEAPIRECELISYDDNKYCFIKVQGVTVEIKRAYIYPERGRCDDVECVSVDKIKELLKEQKAKEFICEVSEKLTRLHPDFKAEGFSDYQSGRYYGIIEGINWERENSNINALDFEIDSLKKEIKLLKFQQEESYSIKEIKDAVKISYGLKYFSEKKFYETLNQIKKIN